MSDRAYVGKWAAILGVEDLWQQLVRQLGPEG